MDLRIKKKTTDYFSFWQLQNKITLFSLVGILFLSTLFAIASIVFTTISTTHFIAFIVMIPTLACFGLATCHSSNLESAKAKKEYEKTLLRLSEVEGSKITLDRFFSISSDVMAVAGQDGLLKKVSRSLVKALGYSEETLLNTPFFEFIHPDDKEATRKSIEALNLGIPSVGFENRYRAADGSYRIFSWSAAADAELGVRFASARDITAERNLKIHMEQILDAVPFLLLVKDLDGKIINCNAAFAKSVGASRDSLVGKKAEIVLSPETISFNHEKEQEVLISQHSLTFEETLMHHGAAVRSHSTVFPIHDQTGKIVSLGKVSFCDNTTNGRS